MRNYLAFGYKQIFSKLTKRTTYIGGIVALVAFSSSFPTPVYGWWFTSNRETTSVTPTHKSGLILSPLAQSILPEFILEPLSKVEKEAPPSVESSESKVPSVVLTTPTPSPTPQVRSSAQQSRSTSVAQQMLDAVNAERAARNLSALVLNSQLSTSAQAYAQQMQNEQFFSHTSPSGSTFKDRNEAAGYTNWAWMGENIAVGQTSVAEVVEDWMNSEGHRANILEPRARELGVGYVGGSSPYWVQEFGAQF